MAKTAGGIAGASFGADVSKCTNHGNISGYAVSAGIIGMCKTPSADENVSPIITNNYSISKITSSYFIGTGGIVGGAYSGIIANNYSITNGVVFVNMGF